MKKLLHTFEVLALIATLLAVGMVVDVWASEGSRTAWYGSMMMVWLTLLMATAAAHVRHVWERREWQSQADVRRFEAKTLRVPLRWRFWLMLTGELLISWGLVVAGLTEWLLFDANPPFLGRLVLFGLLLYISWWLSALLVLGWRTARHGALMRVDEGGISHALMGQLSWGHYIDAKLERVPNRSGSTVDWRLWLALLPAALPGFAMPAWMASVLFQRVTPGRRYVGLVLADEAPPTVLSAVKTLSARWQQASTAPKVDILTPVNGANGANGAAAQSGCSDDTSVSRVARVMRLLLAPNQGLGKDQAIWAPLPRSWRRLVVGAALAGAGLWIAPAAQADIYGYVDAQGTAHFASEKVDERYQLFFKEGQRFDTADGLGRAPAELGRTSAPASLMAVLARAPNFKGAQAALRDAAKRHGMDVELLQALVAAESGFNAQAVSPKGAIGLMQLMPATAERYGVRGDRQRSQEEKLRDPKHNVAAGSRYLRDLIKLFDGDLSLALAAYNAGEGAVQRAGNRIPNYRETQNYVKTVLALYAHLKPGAGAQSPRAPGGRAPARVRMELLTQPGTAQAHGHTD